jgi:hypothetical protein
VLLVGNSLAVEIGALAVGICPYDEQVGRGCDTLVSDTCRDEHGVAGTDGDGSPALPAEAHVGGAGGDAEKFVGVGMVVVEREDAVPPAVAPPVRSSARR